MHPSPTNPATAIAVCCLMAASALPALDMDGKTGRAVGYDRFQQLYPGIDGSGTTVVVIDTSGYCKELLDQNRYTGVAIGTSSPWADAKSHGTMVANIVWQYAPGAHLVLIRSYQNVNDPSTYDNLEESYKHAVTLAQAAGSQVVATVMSLSDEMPVEPGTVDSWRNLSTQALILNGLGVAATAGAGNCWHGTPGVQGIAAAPGFWAVGTVNSGYTSGGGTWPGSPSEIGTRHPGMPGLRFSATLMVPGGATSGATPQIGGAIALLQHLAKSRLGRRLSYDRLGEALFDHARMVSDYDADHGINARAIGQWDRTDGMLPMLDLPAAAASIAAPRTPPPQVWIASRTPMQVTEGNPLTVTLKRDTTARALTVALTYNGVSVNNDLIEAPLTATFAAGSDTATVQVATAADDLVEGVDLLEINVEPGAGYQALWQPLPRVELRDPILPRPVVTIEAPGATVTEYATTSSYMVGYAMTEASFVLRRALPEPSALVVELSYGGTATPSPHALAADDYLELPRYAVIPPFQDSVDLKVWVQADLRDEDPETVIAQVVANPTYDVGASPSATITISDHPKSAAKAGPVVRLVGVSHYIMEGDVAQWEVYRSGGDLTRQLIVPCTFSDSGHRLVTPPRQVVFPANQRRVLVQVATKQGPASTESSTTAMDLTPGSSYVVGAEGDGVGGNDVYVGDPQDDAFGEDRSPVARLVVTQARGTEGGGGATVRVERRSGDYPNLDYVVPLQVHGTASVAGLPADGRVTIPAGSQGVDLTLTMAADSDDRDGVAAVTFLDEPGFHHQGNRITWLTFADAGGGGTLPTVSVAVRDAVASEGITTDKARVRISRTGSTAASLDVSIAYTGAESGDFATQPTGTTVRIPAGAAFKDVVISAQQDADAISESLLTTVLPATGYTVGSPAMAAITLADDDVTTRVAFWNRQLDDSGLRIDDDRGGVPAVWTRLVRCGGQGMWSSTDPWWNAAEADVLVADATWRDHGTAWALGDDLAPAIPGTGLWAVGDNTLAADDRLAPCVRWTNQTGNDLTVDLTGSLELRWPALGATQRASMQVTVVQRDAIGTATVLMRWNRRLDGVVDPSAGNATRDLPMDAITIAPAGSLELGFCIRNVNEGRIEAVLDDRALTITPVPVVVGGDG